MVVFWVALMMEAARTSETLVNFYQTTWRYNPEDSHLLGENSITRSSIIWILHQILLAAFSKYILSLIS
jgi:hypothetical protein